jgi:hypothetical protein
MCWEGLQRQNVYSPKLYFIATISHIVHLGLCVECDYISVDRHGSGCHVHVWNDCPLSLLHHSYWQSTTADCEDANQARVTTCESQQMSHLNHVFLST